MSSCFECKARMCLIVCKVSFNEKIFAFSLQTRLESLTWGDTHSFPPWRCGSATCAVCSRICTVAAPSLPPMPQLTFSPTPSPTRSPMRLALTLSTTNTNVTQPLNVVGKRKKVQDEDDEESSMIRIEGKERDMTDHRPGCGRTFCKQCCFENLQEYVVHYIFQTLGLNLYRF